MDTPIKRIALRSQTDWNYSYYPILFENEDNLLLVEKELKASDILARRYFYPSLSELDYVNAGNPKIAKDLASRILCLPLYYGMKKGDIEKVINFLEHP